MPAALQMLAVPGPPLAWYALLRPAGGALVQTPAGAAADSDAARLAGAVALPEAPGGTDAGRDYGPAAVPGWLPAGGYVATFHARLGGTPALADGGAVREEAVPIGADPAPPGADPLSPEGLAAARATALASAIASVGRPLSVSEAGRTINYGSAAEQMQVGLNTVELEKKLLELAALRAGPFVVRSRVRP